jgi:tetratricopeptide (TPR) repeat protein
LNISNLSHTFVYSHTCECTIIIIIIITIITINIILLLRVSRCVLNAESEVPAAASDAANELSFAYANRSAALYHLKKFTAAIRDVDNALERGYPSKMLYKIHERKARCLRMLGRQREAVASLRAALTTLQYSQLPEDKRQLCRAGIEQDMAALCNNPELCDTHRPSNNNNGLTLLLESGSREAVDNSLTKLSLKSDEIGSNNVREAVNNDSIDSASLSTTFHQQHLQLNNGSTYNIQQTLLTGNNCSTESKSSVSMATRPVWNIPQLYGQNHDFYHSISNAADVKYDVTKGRHLVANRDIRPGHVLLVEKPYASVVFEDFYKRRCYACFQQTSAPEPCLQCSTVCYCSAICRETAWHDYHRYECRYMAVYKRDWCGRMGHLAARVAMVTGVETMLRENIDNDVIIHSDKITEHKVSTNACWF